MNGPYQGGIEPRQRVQTFPNICKGNPVYASTDKISDEAEKDKAIVCHTRTSVASLQGGWLFHVLGIMVERRVRAILEIIYEARDQGDQGKLDHAKTLATRTKKKHLVEVSLVSIEQGID